MAVEIATPLSHRKVARSCPPLSRGPRGPSKGHFDPPGNVIASKLRHIFDDSSSMFPESTYSTDIRKQRRWQSVVQSDYKPILNWREVFVTVAKPPTSLPFRDEPPKVSHLSPCMLAIGVSLSNSYIKKSPTAKWVVPSS